MIFKHNSVIALFSTWKVKTKFAFWVCVKWNLGEAGKCCVLFPGRTYTQRLWRIGVNISRGLRRDETIFYSLWDGVITAGHHSEVSLISCCSAGLKATDPAPVPTELTDTQTPPVFTHQLCIFNWESILFSWNEMHFTSHLQLFGAQLFDNTGCRL